MIINAGKIHEVRALLKRLNVPDHNSHKGQNGKLLIVGGSSLFHAAPFWAAEVASHFVDIVHYASTEENNIIFRQTKKRFHNGIVVSREHVDEYLSEDDTVLVGPGLVRGHDKEAAFSRDFTKHVLLKYPEQKKVLDAGSLQTMDTKWFSINNKHTERITTIITPHQLEFENLFHRAVLNKPIDEKIAIVRELAKKFNILILLKAVDDIISDGESVHVVRGGNFGLTKGGTGDILAGLTASLFTTNDAMISACAASCLLKATAESLFEVKGYWYNNDDLLENIPVVFKKFLYN